jgi:hypothetical protein
MTTSATQRPATLIENQLLSLGDKLDRADSDAIHAIFMALQPLNSPRLAKVKRRALREAIQEIWQEPRMPKNRFSHDKPLDYPWSPNARDLYFAHQADRSVTIQDRLDLVPFTPIGHLTDQLEARFADAECTEEEFLMELKKVHAPLCFAVLTKDEHNALRAAAINAATVAGEGTTAWDRYEIGSGLQPEDFISITADPRYTAAD